MDSPTIAPNACLACRKIKVRCRVSADNPTGTCVRCERKTLECVFQRHRRGRKPGTRLSKGRPSAVSAGADVWLTPAAGEPIGSEQMPDSCTADRGTVASALTAGPPEPTLESADGLQPSGLLNCQTGRFSLRQILSADEPGASERTREVTPAHARDAEDPVRLGLVNDALARLLFDNFMRDLNPYICQFDPALHTFRYVEKHSLFLLTSILAASAKAFNPFLYKPLYEHAQKLYNDTFARGVYSPETAQAILLLTYWKEPQDNRAWTTLGYVVRMCMDLGWHRISPSKSSTRASPSEMEDRKLRNVERTWLVLFVYDRSISLQTGRPWMIERSDFIEGAEAWCQNPLATEDDILLASFVTLRLETCDTFTALSREYLAGNRTSVGSTNSLLALSQDRIQRWESRWTQMLRARQHGSGDQHCHHLLLRFYGTHAKLQLSSLPLQSILASGDAETPPGLSIMWSAYTSALTMLQLIHQYARSIYFAQDSLHVMTAYSAAFLMKLLFFAPTDFVREIEVVVLEAIDTAAKVFSAQQAPASSSCALQAKFLGRIASRIERRRSEGQSHREVARAADAPGRAAGYGEEVTVEWEDGAAALTQRVSRVSDGYRAPYAVRQEQLDLFSDEDNIWDGWFVTAGFGAEEGMFFA